MNLQDYDLKQLVVPLRDWFVQHARVLPWREDPSPYHVWISEIMLQQTRVEAVKAYYTRFIKELPDVASLADCEEDRYLKLWEGLGYYSRVRNLHAAAVQVMQQYDGRIPDNYDQLLGLKGIGSYTAGAIASLAYGKPVPAVDGNVLRVLTRVSADETDIMKQSFRSQTESLLKDILDYASPEMVTPGVFNQGLMELGALVCVPNGQPHCSECPWNSMCLARKEHRTEQIPVKSGKKERRKEKRTVILIRDGDKIALHKRSSRGLLAGMYEFPNKDGHLSESRIISLVKDMGYSPLRIKRLADSVHVFSHVEWHMIAYSVLVEEEEFASDEQKLRAEQEHLVFADAAQLEKHYALPSAFAAYRQEI